MQLEFRGMKWILDHIRRLIAVFSPKPASGYEPITPTDSHQTDLVPSSDPQRSSERIKANVDASRKDPGVEDGLKNIPGVTTRMLIAFGKHGIKSIEDLADCATDDLNGWSETKDGKTIKHTGILGRFKVSRQDCEAMIMDARAKAGWFK
jgi:hypothetical protein